jgi:hypothetical protein
MVRTGQKTLPPHGGGRVGLKHSSSEAAFYEITPWRDFIT